jgi:hypothetical protein
LPLLSGAQQPLLHWLPEVQYTPHPATDPKLTQVPVLAAYPQQSVALVQTSPVSLHEFVGGSSQYSGGPHTPLPFVVVAQQLLLH